MSQPHIQIREVRLYLGPSDGTIGCCSHDTCAWGEPLELYVWDGSQDRNSFIHARSSIERLPRAQRRQEEREFGNYIAERQAWDRKIIAKSLPLTSPPPLPPRSIPAWRLNAWWQLHAYGQI